MALANVSGKVPHDDGKLPVRPLNVEAYVCACKYLSKKYLRISMEIVLKRGP